MAQHPVPLFNIISMTLGYKRSNAHIETQNLSVRIILIGTCSRASVEKILEPQDVVEPG